MRTCREITTVSALLALTLSVCVCADTTMDFDSNNALEGWQIEGDATLDATRNRDGGAGGALRIGPGAKAVLPLRDEDGAGVVEMWVYDDCARAENPKDRRVGPRWGLIQGDGRVLVVGALYAPYLSGDTTYCASDSDQKTTWFNVQYLGVRRDPTWHRWTFTMDPAKGLSIGIDGTDVNARTPRFDWNKTQFRGFQGIAVFGDEMKAPAHTIWVDDITAQLGGPMAAAPVPPPPPPPVVPAADPAPDEPVDIIPELRGKHPRLLFSAEDIPAMRERIAGPSKVFFDKMLAYLQACKPPDHTRWVTDATDAQRQGVWRLPTVALHYVLTGEQASLENALGFMRKFLETPDWETTSERNSGMGAANIMVGAALAYDWLYDSLAPDFRERFRRKLLNHARWQYYGGHLNGNKATAYWQSDPQNNHRWHRDAGLALCALAVAGDGPGWEWILSKTREELEFVHQWLPEDGSCHESPSYMVFGMPYLVLAFDAADRCLGTQFLRHAYFRNNPLFRMHTLLPGFTDAFCFGDAGGTGFINDYAFRCTAIHELGDLQNALMQFHAADPETSFNYGWFSVIWFDTSLEGSIEDVPTNALYPDLGLALVRDGWGPDAVAAMFKCGPYGGVALNEFRNETGRYINIAHDDPDCGMFTLFAGGAMLAEDDRYAYNKQTASHNTILVNGKGQIGEGSGHWMQPIRNVDMNTVARVVAWRSTPQCVIADGEAAKAYVGLERFRRTFIWMPGRYILVLDDIRSAAPVDVTWLLQAPSIEEPDAVENAWRLVNGAAGCPVYVGSDLPFDSDVVDSPADNRGEPIGFRQIRLSASGAQWRLATLLDPWGRCNPGVTLAPQGPDAAEVSITCGGVIDTWRWDAAEDESSPTQLICTRNGQTVAHLGADDRVPNSGPPLY